MSPPEAEPVNRRLGLNGATTGSADLMIDLRVAHEAGFDALEVRDQKLRAHLRRGGSLEGFRAAAEAAGVAIASLNALEGATLTETVGRPAVLERARTLFGWAQALRCPMVVVVPGPRAGAPSVQQIRPRTVEMLRVLRDTAAPFGVRIGFEFLGFADASVSTLAAAREIVEEVDDPGVGLVIDAFHFYVGGSTLRTLEGLPADRLLLVHLDDAEDLPRDRLTDAHRLLPGRGVLPLRDLVAALDGLGYRGVYSVELFRPEYWAWDPLELATAARASLQAVLSGGEGAGR